MILKYVTHQFFSNNFRIFIKLYFIFFIIIIIWYLILPRNHRKLKDHPWKPNFLFDFKIYENLFYSELVLFYCLLYSLKIFLFFS